MVLRLGPFTQKIRTQHEKTREHLRWLAERGYIRDLVLERGRAEFCVPRPGSWNPVADTRAVANA